MKYFSYTLGIAFVLCASVLSSCKKDFLETPPGIATNEDQLFASPEKVELYIAQAYKYCVPTFLPQREGPNIVGRKPDGTTQGAPQRPFAGATDEADEVAGFVSTNDWNNGLISVDNIHGSEDWMYFGRYAGVRACNIILERINEVPATADFKAQIRGEALFLRAMANFEILKRYGGFPIIKTRQSIDEASDLKRDKLADCVNFILADCDEAYTILNTLPATHIYPVGFNGTMSGRANKSSAKALKSRLLLYAASPLFNTGTPYISMNNPADNLLICYGDENPQRWELAATAATEALTAAISDGFALLDVPAKRTYNGFPVAGPHTAPFIGNYRDSWEILDNQEILLSYKGFGRSSYFGHPWQHLMQQFRGFGAVAFWGITDVNHRFIKRYESRTTGEPITWAASGADVMAMYNTLDSRFNQTVGFNGSRWLPTMTTPVSYLNLELYTGGAHQDSRTSAVLKKLTPDAIQGGNGNEAPRISVFRYNELLLNYAEAQNEFAGPGTNSRPRTVNTTADYAALPASTTIPLSPYDAVNMIRRRSGMPLLPGGLTKDQFRVRLRNERAIELAFENYRFWDIRRWLIADQDEKAMSSPLLGLTLVKQPDGKVSWVEKEVESRIWRKRFYLHPFERNEFKRNLGFVQNPGY